jgi:hypothetical protein
MRHPELRNDRRREDAGAEGPAEHFPELRVKPSDAELLKVFGAGASDSPESGAPAAPILLEDLCAPDGAGEREVGELDGGSPAQE